MEQFATEAEVMRAAADRTDDTNADVNREIDRVQHCLLYTSDVADE